MRGRAFALLAVAGLLLPLGGCVPGDWLEAMQIAIFGQILYPNGGPGPYAKGTPLEESITADVTANFGGLDGTYDITIDDPDGGTFGSFSGTGTVKRERFVTLKDNESEGLYSTVAAMLGKALDGESVDLTKAKAKVTAYQTPGGVEKHFKLKISFAGTITSGPSAGNTVKGKMTSEGQF